MESKSITPSDLTTLWPSGRSTESEGAVFVDPHIARKHGLRSGDEVTPVLLGKIREEERHVRKGKDEQAQEPTLHPAKG